MEFVKPDLIWGKKKVPYTTLTWSGTDTQASREIRFEVPWDPYDKSVPKLGIAKGDVVELRVNGKKYFVGQITSRDKTDQIGTASYTARDFMHHLLGSTGTYIFKKTTPEAITKKVCKDVGVTTTGLFKTGISIKKMIFENQCLYDIIIKAYRKVKSETGKKYLPVMVENKVSVIEKGEASGVTLTQGVNITNATYSDTIDNMIDLVKIYNDKHKKVGEVKNDKNLSKYGVYQTAYQKEDGKSSTKAAKALLVGTTREAAVEALGDIRAISGYSIKIKDPATGLEGKFFITSDTHTFENNTHTMKLELSWKDSMEEGAETWKAQKTTTASAGGGSIGGGAVNFNMPKIKTPKIATGNDKQFRSNEAWAFFLDVKTGAYGYAGNPIYAQTYYHSSTACKNLKKEQKKYNTTLTYSKKVKDIINYKRITKAPNTVTNAFRSCHCCWY
jgi:hypothetical protein